MRIPIFFNEITKDIEVPLTQSPSDVPTSVQVGDNGIEFRYPIEESHIKEYGVKPITIRIGEASGKVYEVELESIDQYSGLPKFIKDFHFEKDHANDRFLSNFKLSKQIISKALVLFKEKVS